MKSVLIVTKISRNYGALLQAYALQRTLEELGAKVQVLNLNFPQTSHTYRVLPRITGLRSLRNFIHQFPDRKQRKLAIQRSLQFREQYLQLTQEYPDYESVTKRPPKADIYLTGSDQVWNPTNNFDKSYYLLFAPEGSVRASYAASIAIPKIPEALEAEFIRRVRTIPFRSVREESGRKLLMQLGMDALTHPDPTILRGRQEYEQMAVRPEYREPYVLLYLLITPPDAEALIQRVRELYPGRKIVTLFGANKVSQLGDWCEKTAGPREFLGLVRWADAVVTTSFHGVVFAGLFEKEFAALLPEGTGLRISELLTAAGMEHHIIPTADALHRENLVGGLLTKAMEPRRAEALEYLRTILDAAG